VAAPAAVVDEQEVRRVYLQGVEHYTKGELAEAIASWREVLKLDPKNEKASSNIARAEDKLKEASGKGVK
jgi:cytochrome c-type biogenesis protein CcmH/NrfG